MHAELRTLFTSEPPDDALESYRPADSEHFAVLVEASVGVPGGRGQDLFSFEVCTPSWLATQTFQKDFAFQRNLLVKRWDAALVERAIADLCRRTEGDTWEEVAWKLSRYAHWEFEDYDPVPRRS